MDGNINQDQSPATAADATDTDKAVQPVLVSALHTKWMSNKTW